MEYKSRDVQRLFKISAETVRVWAEEFSEYLSPNATPGTGRHRIFNHDDLQVFALVAEYRDMGRTFSDAHVVLKMGQRKEVDIDALETGIVLQSALQLEVVESRLAELANQLQAAEDRARQLHDENIRLKTRLEYQEKLETELEVSRAEVNKLTREMGRLEALLEIERAKKQDDS